MRPRSLLVGLQLVAGGKIEIDEDRPFPDDGEDSRISPTTGALGNAWAHVRVVYVVTGDSVKFDALMGGMPFASTTTVSTALTPPAEVTIGNCIVAPNSGTWAVRVDNVVIDAK